MVPLYDDNPYRFIRFAWVNWSIIALNVVIYAAFLSGWHPRGFFADAASLSASYGMIPSVLLHQAALPPELDVIPSWLTPVTSMFLHGSWMHLAGNMLFLWVLGDNIEDDLGHLNYLVFYLGCGILGGVAHALANPSSNAPLIGASSAVSGVVVAYVLLHPRSTMWVLVLLRLPLPLPAWTALGGWIVFQLYKAWASGGESDVAWLAHVGGILGGALLVAILKRPEVRFFGRPPIDRPDSSMP